MSLDSEPMDTFLPDRQRLVQERPASVGGVSLNLARVP
jgi:hypothetical protein